MSICKHGVDSKEATCANCANENHSKASLKTRKLIAGLTKFISPLFGHRVSDGCVCCGIHEAVTPKHTVWHNEVSGSSILCEGCWRDLSTSEKIRYYKIVYERQWVNGNESWEKMEKAIRYPYYWRYSSGTFLTIEPLDS